MFNGSSLAALTGAITGGFKAFSGGNSKRDDDAFDEIERRRAEANHVRSSEEDSKLVELVSNRFDEAERAKERYYEKWATQYFFYKNEHYQEWNATTRQMVGVADAPSYRVRMTDNLVTKMVLNLAGRRSQAAHVTHGVPNSSSSKEDLETSMIASKVLRHCEAVSDYGRKRMEALILSTIYGTAFYAPYWDENSVASVAESMQDEEGNIIHRNAGRAMVGEYALNVCNVWEVFPQPMDKWEKVRWVIQAQVYSLDEIRATYPERGILVQKESEVTMSRTLGSINPATGTSRIVDPDTPTARVKHYYEKPSRKYPQGRYAVVAGKVLLDSFDMLPHPNLRFPLIPVYGIPDPESIWGIGWIELGIDQQRMMNRMLSVQVEDMNMLGRPKVLLPRRCRVHDDAFHSGPGEVITYDPDGGKPEPFIGAPRSPFSSELFALAKNEFQDATGVTQISYGQQEGSVTAASAMLLMSRHNDIALNVSVQLEAAAVRELAQYAIELVAERYDVPRFIRVTGPDNETEVLSFLGSDLRGNTEIDVRASDGVSDTPEYRRTSGLELLSVGAIQLATPEARVEFLRILNEPQYANLMQREAERIKELQVQQQEQEAAAMQAQQEQMAEQQEQQEQMAADQQAQEQERQAQEMLMKAETDLQKAETETEKIDQRAAELEFQP